MDEIILKVGEFGRFQLLLFVATSSCTSLCVLGVLFMVFGNYNPGWMCANNVLASTMYNLENNETVPVYNGSTTEVEDCFTWSRCESIVYNTEASTVVTEWNLQCENSWIPSLMITVQMLGILIGSIVGGTIGDRFGRRTILYGSVAFFTLSNLVCAFSNTWQMFAVFRSLIGLAVGGIFSASFGYPMEFISAWWRAALTSVPQWSIGSIAFSLLVFIFKDWRQYHLATAAVSLALFLPVFWIPESMRWLAVNNQVDTLESVIQRMASMNRRQPVDRELILETTEKIIESQKASPTINYLDLFKTPRLRGYSIKFGLSWMLMAVMFYIITFGIKSFSGNFYLNITLLSLTEFPCIILAGPLANKFGRRYSSLFFFSLSFVACCGIIVSQFVSAITNSVSTSLTIISKASLLAGWYVVELMSTELYPTVVRNMHFGYIDSMARLGAIIAAYIVPSDQSKILVSYVVIAVLLIVTTGLAVSVPESKGRAMGDTIGDRFVNKELDPMECQRLDRNMDNRQNTPYNEKENC